MTPPAPITRQQLQVINRQSLKYALDTAEKDSFYDLYLIFEHFQFPLAEIVALVRRKEVRSPITSDALHGNWQRAVADLSAGRDPVQYSRAIADSDIAEFVAQIRFDPIPAEG